MRVMAGTTGGVLILGGCLLLTAAVVTGATGPAGPDGTPLRDLGMLILCVGLASLASGAGVLGLAGPRPLAGRSVRVGLVVLAVGLVSLAGCILTPIPAGSNTMASGQYVVLGGVGFLGIGAGTLVTDASLIRATGGSRLVGALFLVGLLMVIVFSLLANGVVALGSLRPLVEGVAAIGGGVVLAAVAGLGIIPIRAAAVPAVR